MSDVHGSLLSLCRSFIEFTGRPSQIPSSRTASYPDDAEAFPFEHARNRPGAAPDFDSVPAQPLQSFDACAIDEGDSREVETDGDPEPKKPVALQLQQGCPLPHEVSLEPQRCPGAPVLLLRDPHDHVDLLVASTTSSPKARAVPRL